MSQLTRSHDDKMVAGVLGGIAEHYGFESTWLRIGYALLTIFTAVVPCALIYLAAAVIIPQDS